MGYGHPTYRQPQTRIGLWKLICGISNIIE